VVARWLVRQLYPCDLDLHAFRVLLIAATGGHAPEEVTGLTEDDVEFLPGGVRLTLTKQRAGRIHKADFVRSLGADEVVQYTDSDWGAPITVAVDGVGGRVLQRGLAALAPFGRLVSYSAASGPIETHELLAGMKTAIGFAMGRLASAQPQLVEQLRHDLWDLLAHGRLHPEIHAELPLEEAPKAYEILKARANLGKIVLRPTKRTT
jgi:NADPH:quinone reductase-like Zn-dependent oxidoreductase